MEKEPYDPTKPFNDQIKKLIQDTHPKDGPIIFSPCGKRFSMHEDSDYLREYETLDATDGIGTKGLIYWLMFKLTGDVGYIARGSHDAAAMVWDDLIEGNFEPYKLQDHIMMQEENEQAIFALIRELRNLCLENPWEVYLERKSPIIISGGETAIINTLQGFEMGITATGKVKRGEEIISNARPEDVRIGIESSGAHSNGYTFLREEFLEKRGMNLEDKFFDSTLGEELAKPTRLYLPAIKELLKNNRKDVSGMVHITGGAFTKLKELMPNKDVDIYVTRHTKLKPQPIFYYINKNFSINSESMYKKFNNGIGYVVAMKPHAVDYALDILNKYFLADIIGEVRHGSGKVLIESQFDKKVIKYN